MQPYPFPGADRTHGPCCGVVGRLWRRRGGQDWNWSVQGAEGKRPLLRRRARSVKRHISHRIRPCEARAAAWDRLGCEWQKVDWSTIIQYGGDKDAGEHPTLWSASHEGVEEPVGIGLLSPGSIRSGTGVRPPTRLGSPSPGASLRLTGWGYGLRQRIVSRYRTGSGRV